MQEFSVEIRGNEYGDGHLPEAVYLSTGQGRVVLPRAHLAVLGALALGGHAREKEIRTDPLVQRVFAGRINGPTPYDIWSRMQDMSRYGLIRSEMVSLGARGYRYRLYELTPLGEQFCREVFGQEPVTPESQVLIAQHDSLEHGLLIKEAAELLKRSGYQVWYRRGEVPAIAVPTLSGRRGDRTAGERERQIRPDLMASLKPWQNPHERTVLWVECERGTHGRPDFFAKIEQYAELARPLYLVVPNRKVRRHLVGWIEEYRLRREAMGDPRPVITYIAALEDLARGQWTAV